MIGWDHLVEMERVERRFDLRPRRLAGDTAYGAVRLLIAKTVIACSVRDKQLLKKSTITDRYRADCFLFQTRSPSQK